MKKILLAILIITGAQVTSQAQLTQTDEFDFWEDQTTHNFTEINTRLGAYVCDTDSTLRISDGEATIELAVTPNSDTIKIEYYMPWINSEGPYLEIDGESYGQPGGATCGNIGTIMIYDPEHRYTYDGIIHFKLYDEQTGNTGDGQISHLWVYSSKENLTDNKFTGTDHFDFWEDQSSHSYETTGNAREGAYTCGSNKTLRIGDASATITLNVTPKADSIKIYYYMPWSNSGGPEFIIDGNNYGTPGSAYCSNIGSLYIEDLEHNLTSDGTIELTIIDDQAGNTGDGQIAYLWVTSKTIVPITGIWDKESKSSLYVSQNDNVLSIFSEQAILSSSIINMRGVAVQTQENKTNINTEQLSSGYYILKVVTNKETVSQRFYKQ